MFDSAANLFSAQEYLINGEFKFITHTPDSHYLLCGSESFSSNGLIMETNFAGNPTLIKRYVINKHKTNFLIAHPLKNGHRLYIGTAEVNSLHFTINLQLALLETDSLGNVFWNSQIGDTSLWITNPKAIVELQDSSILIFANVQSQVGDLGILVLKLSASRQVIWHKLYCSSGSGVFRVLSAIQQLNGTINFSGHKSPGGSFICNMDTAGTIQVAIQFNDSSGDNNLLQCKNGTLLCASILPSIGGYIRHQIIMTDSSFNFVCQESNFAPQLCSYLLYDSSGYSVLNMTATVSPIPLSKFSDSLFTPVNYVVCNTVNIQTLPDEKNLIVISPNPSTGIFNFETSVRSEEISIFNLQGEIVTKKTSAPAFGFIDLSNQSPGIYYCKIISVNNLETIKLVAQ